MRIVISIDDVPNILGDVRVEMGMLDPAPIGRSDSDVRRMVQELLTLANDRIGAAYGLDTPFNR